ncbi:MAG: hypothetical protein MHM6MM_008362 [Cercozoa sp. M6MM]
MSAEAVVHGREAPITEEERPLIEQFRVDVAPVVSEFADSHVAQRVAADDFLVVRFLRARGLDVPKAIEMFKNMLVWRKEFDTDNALTWKFDKWDQVHELYPHYYFGFDKHGRPLYIDAPGKLNVSALLELLDMDTMLKLHVAEAEYLNRVMKIESQKRNGLPTVQTATIVDLDGFAISKLNSQVREFLRRISAVDQDNYPESMGKMFIINAPWVFKAAWKVIRPWLHERTRAKIEIVGSDYKKAVCQEFGAENLPAFLGGDLPPTSHVEAAKFCQHEERMKRLLTTGTAALC